MLPTGLPPVGSQAVGPASAIPVLEGDGHSALLGIGDILGDIDGASILQDGAVCSHSPTMVYISEKDIAEDLSCAAGLHRPSIASISGVVDSAVFAYCPAVIEINKVNTV